jgi:hypothetical protein
MELRAFGREGFLGLLGGRGERCCFLFLLIWHVRWLLPARCDVVVLENRDGQGAFMIAWRA